MTEPQRMIQAAATHCGIRKGMSRAELVEAMTVCIPEFYKERKGVKE